MSATNLERLTDIFSETDLVIFDNDGVLYPFNEHLRKHLLGIYIAIVSDITKMTPEETVKMGFASYAQCGDFYESFVLGYGQSRLDVHQRHHDMIDHTLIPVDDELAQIFDNFHLPRAILTHGNRDWTHRVLERRKLSKHFPASKIYPWEAVGFEKKSASEKPFVHVLDAEGCQAARSVMVEDTPKNLLYAKKIGMKTILVRGDRTFDPAEHPYIDLIVDRLHPVIAGAHGISPTRDPQRIAIMVVETKFTK